MSRRRQIGILLLTVHPSRRRHCVTCRPRNIPAQEERVTLRHTLRDPQLAQDDRAAAHIDVAMILLGRELGHPLWYLPSWIPEGRLEEWNATLRNERAMLVPTQARQLRPRP